MKKDIHSTKGIKRRHAVATAVVAGLVLSGCANQNTPADKPVAASTPVNASPVDAFATVNGVPLTRAQVSETLRASGLPDSAAQRAEIEHGLVVRELIRQAADAEKIGDAPEVRAAASKARIDTENRLYIATHAKARPVTEEQVRARYDEIVASLGPMSYKPRLIVLPSETAVQAALARLARHERFDSIATKESLAPSKANGGALPWVSLKTPVTEGNTQGLPVEVARALVQLHPGDYTRSAIAVGQVRMLVKLDGKVQTAVPRYEQVRGELIQSLQSRAQTDAFNAMVDSLAKKAVITSR